MPDTMNARPVREAATSTASFGPRPRRRSSMKRRRISEVNSVHAAITSGPPTAVIGLSLRLSPHATSDAVPTAMSTGTSDNSDRTTERSRTERKQEHEQDREVGQQDAVASRLSSSPDADHGQPAGVAVMPAGGCVSVRISRTIGARSSSDATPVRNTMLRWCVRRDRRRLEVLRGDVERGLHVGTARRDLTRPRHIDEVADGGLDARAGLDQPARPPYFASVHA